MGSADGLLSIGVFARRSRLSVKALRLYDRVGLLTPAAVDQDSGYRRYRDSQLLTARLIVLMRRAGIPLAQVAEILAAPGQDAADLLASYWAEAERAFAARRELVARLRASLLSGTGTMAASGWRVSERDVPAQRVLTEQRSLAVAELKSWLPGALRRLAGAAGLSGGLGGALFVIYHGEVNEDSDGPVEACAPLTGPVEGLPARLEPAHREAYVTITRAQLEFPQILSAYDAVADWIGANGRQPAGSPREVYSCGVDVAAAAPHDLVCDVAFPVTAG